MKIIFLTISLIILSFSAYSATYYIDPSQTDPSEDGSIEHPFDSWSDVTWAPGNSYLQKCGTTAYGSTKTSLNPCETPYSIQVPAPCNAWMYWGDGTCVINVTASGTKNNPIILGSYGTGSRPIITGQNPSTGVLDVDYGIVVIDQDYVYITNLEIKYIRCLAVVFEAYEADHGHNTLDNCYVHNCGMGMFMVGPNSSTGAASINNIVQNCEFYRCSFGAFPIFQARNNVITSSISSYCDTHGFSSYGNYFDIGVNTGNIFNHLFVSHSLPNNPAWSVGQSYIAGESRVTVDGHGKYICIKSHTSSVENAPPEGRTADPDIFVNDYWYAYAFTWWNDEGAGIQLDDLTSNGIVDSCIVSDSYRGIVANRAPGATIKNNYVINSTEYGIGLSRWTDSRGLNEGPGASNIINNTVINSGLYGLLYIGLNNLDNITFRNNIITGSGSYGIYYNYITGGTFTEDHNCFYGNELNYYGHSLAASDITSNPLLTGYVLGSSSPCIDAGTSTDATTDIIGRTRDASFDIGAYEYIPSMLGPGYSGTASWQ